ncbi:hypothetical protein OPV22_024447 [Ensete ventricosum]|uniref:DUF4378 domain-containing protein n=1 Tax=Ensete ventricosum TaxID=4639 RepID=A0AAV8QGS5_ENSVE|nr:hypothetical protein OPV22_024447 [Ensete ventricosum]
MASVPKPMPHGMRLFELLEEQQEPFLLDVYLLERGYSDRAMKTNAAAFLCWPAGACRRLTRLSTHGFKRKKRAGFLRCLLNKVVCIRKAWRWDAAAATGDGGWRLFGSFFEMKGKDDAADFRRLSCSGGTDGAEPDREEQWRAFCSSNHLLLSPVSVLELHSDQVGDEEPSISSFNSSKETKEAAPWKGFEQQLHSNRHDPPRRRPDTECRHLFQPHYFLVVDCLREVEGKLSTSHGCSSPERRGKIVQEETWSWEDRRGGLGDDISQLIDFDFSKSRKEWNHFQQETGEVGIEIEHIIFEEIREETVLDVLRCHCTLARQRDKSLVDDSRVRDGLISNVLCLHIALY